MTNCIGLRPWSLAVVAVALVFSVATACGGQVGVPVQTQPTNFEQPDETEPPVVPGGTWTGTITLHGVINEDKTEDVTSGDPGSTYYETGTTHDTTQVDVTDTFNVTATDDDDLTYGISSVEFEGTAANAGSTLERYIQNWNKQNSGCTWKEELGDETSGNWNSTGRADGELRFSDDGEYSIDISASVGDENGEYETPQLPHRIWLKVSDPSAGCSGDTGYDTTETQGPLIWWASSSLGQSEVNGNSAYITGQVNGTPGTTIDGSMSFDLKSPAMKLDATWHLVHSSPIILPHS